MAIHMEERFVVNAPPAAVWDFLVDPRRVVGCVPGGELYEVSDDRNFRGRVRVIVGPLMLAYGGRIRLAEADAVARRVKIVGLARDEDGDDSARLTLESWLTPTAGRGTEVVALARIDVGGPLVALGAPFLQQLSHVVFQDFSACVCARIEAASAPGRTSAADRCAGPRAPLRALPLVWKALRAWAATALHRRGRV